MTGYGKFLGQSIGVGWKYEEMMQRQKNQQEITVCKKIHLTMPLDLQVVYDTVSNDIHLLFMNVWRRKQNIPFPTSFFTRYGPVHFISSFPPLRFFLVKSLRNAFEPTLKTLGLKCFNATVAFLEQL